MKKGQKNYDKLPRIIFLFCSKYGTILLVGGNKQGSARMMNIKNVCYILIFLSMVMIVGMSGCTSKNVDTKNDKIQTPVINASTNNSNTSSGVAPMSTNICENCHMSGKSSVPQAMTVKPHIEGGAYCLTCHKSLHDKHPIDTRVTCANCHEGEDPTKPTFINGSIVCNNCHDYPDPMRPSYGNLVTIHENRGVTCIICHTQKCTKCHEKVNTSEIWQKRSNHFKIMLDMLKYSTDI